MNRIVYIAGDLPVEITQEDYNELFTKEEIVRLEEGLMVEFVDGSEKFQVGLIR